MGAGFLLVVTGGGWRAAGRYCWGLALCWSLVVEPSFSWSFFSWSFLLFLQNSAGLHFLQRRFTLCCSYEAWPRWKELLFWSCSGPGKESQRAARYAVHVRTLHCFIGNDVQGYPDAFFPSQMPKCMLCCLLACLLVSLFVAIACLLIAFLAWVTMF